MCLCVEGGTVVIDHACDALKKDIPLVIVNDSGRAASVLAMAYKSDGLNRLVFIGFITFSTHLIHVITSVISHFEVCEY